MFRYDMIESLFHGNTSYSNIKFFPQSFDRETNWQLLKTLVRLEEGYARGQEAVNKVDEL